MLLFAGLGNPGKRYARHRHNIGFLAVETIARRHGFARWQRGFEGDLAEGRIGGEKVICLKPQTYMNESGRAVGTALRYFKLESRSLTVFHDELDLAPGKLRVKQGGGHAGHNGLRSLHQHVGADYNRVRIGIGHPGHKDLVSPYVLHDFARADRDWLDPLLAAVGREADRLAARDAPGFLNAVALATRPARPAAKREGASGNGGRRKAVEQPAQDPEPKSVLEKLVAMFARK